jgi:hypothetical protein
MMSKRRHHQNLREGIETPEEDEVEEIRIGITIDLHIMTKIKNGKCPPKTSKRKEVGKSTRGMLHQTK